jgi:hypothetical protein
MRRIETMKTLSVHRAALDRLAQHIDGARTIRPETRCKAASTAGAAIERQLDEIQCTFGVRWEW